MKKALLLLTILFGCVTLNAQTSCSEVLAYVKSTGYGTEYMSYTSTAISKVTFYNITIDYKKRYFAVVCFKREYSYGCSEYIYQVGYNTELNYSLNYLDSAGKAFSKYINPYNKNLNCAPNYN